MTPIIFKIPGKKLIPFDKIDWRVIEIYLKRLSGNSVSCETTWNLGWIQQETRDMKINKNKINKIMTALMSNNRQVFNPAF